MLISLIKFTVLFYVTTGVLLFIFQRNFLYYPTQKINHAYRVEPFSVNGESIEVVVLNQGREKALIYFGGNGEPVAMNADDFRHVFQNHTVYLVNYRGYGGSTGSPDEQSLYSDALHIYSRIEQQHATISVVGRSLGSGVATYLASEKPIEKLILITPYDSIQNVAQDKFPFYPMSLLLWDKYDSVGRVGKISAETLVLLAEYDQIIPAKYSNRLISAFPKSQIKVKTIKGVGHNSISNRESYYLLLQDFIR
ncbi:MAG: alpha/beta hydrolase [Chromatiales bacterium]|nr:alpha/beta hydrolase [Chromatiales bacterium]